MSDWLISLLYECTCVCVRAQPEAFCAPAKKPEALHNEWRGGSAAMQTVLAGAEHEKALIAPIQPSALKPNVTHTAREAEANQKHSVCHSFTSGLASAKLLFALEPVSHLVFECHPKLCFLFEKGEGGERQCSSWIAPSCEESTTCLYRMLLKYL